ncbi:MAG: hypothetical protein ACXVAY_18520 [Mucilaginibacter sp.]
MNTKLIMTLSAVILGAIGIALTFFPDEILQYAAVNATMVSKLAIQLLGALYFGFAMLNWMAKGAIIGGIYNKPISTANFTHFFIGAAALLKVLIHQPASCWVLWAVGGVYLVFAICFGFIFTTHPGTGDSSK